MSTLAAILGRDPWAFELLSPARDFAYVIFGWTYYEAAECLSILVRARERWKSPVYLGIAVALFCQVLSTTTISLHASATRDVSDDFFLGPTKFAIDITTGISQLVGRWAYFYATVTISLAVFPTNQLVKVLLCLTTIVGVVGNMVYTVAWMHFMRLGHDQYVIYNETNNPSIVIGRVKTVIVPFVQKYYGSTALSENISVFVFIVFTKVPFLLKIYKSLNVGVRQALWSMVTTRTSQRLLGCVIVATIEAILAFVATRDIKRTVSNYSRVFQINSLAIMAFEGAAAIIKEHSKASRASSQDKSKTVSGATPGTTPRKPLLRSDQV